MASISLLNIHFDMFDYRICIVTVAEWHPLLREKKTISQISYDVEGVNRMDNKISGKGKRV